MSRPPDPTADAIREVRAIYADLERRPPRRNCTGAADCCRFRLTGKTPYLTRGEAWVAAAAWRASGRTAVKPGPDGSCPFLGPDGRCRIYEGRPFGCRTHFCEAAGGPMARGEVRDLIQRLEEIDHRSGGSGAVNLPAAMQAAMAAKSGGKRR